MAFDKTQLSPLAYGNGFTLWHYVTADLTTVVDTAGYFSDEAVDMMKLGDVVIVVTVDDVANPTSVTTTGLHIVNQSDGTTVDIANALALTVTDTD